MARSRTVRTPGGCRGFKRGDIEAHHRSLEEQFSEALAEEVQIEKPENWWHRADQGIVAFGLVGKKSGRSERAQRKDRGWHQVVPAREREGWWSECRAWVSWYEEWISHAAMAFELRSAGLTVFWGPPQAKYQIVRAEWAEPPRHGGAGGQPHWHADFDQFVDGVFTQEDTGESLNDSQEPLFPQDSKALGINLSGCHLAMAGWQRTDIEGNSWQASIGSDLGRLTDWGVLTLIYITSQLAQCRRSSADA